MRKAYSMTGWRIGYLAGPAGLVRSCIDLQGQMTTNASSIAQRAALAALDSGTSLIGEMVGAFRRRRGIALSELRAEPGVRLAEPEGAFYVFPDLSAFFGKAATGGAPIRGSDELADYLLESARVAVVPGSAFGDDRSVRISFATDDERLREGLGRVRSALAALR